MIRHPPAVAGKVINETFCGMTMVQHDADGNVLFLHRNSNKLTGMARRGDSDNLTEAVRRATAKLASKNPKGRKTPKFKEVQDELKAIEKNPRMVIEALEPDGYPDPVIWTHLLSFKSTLYRSKYVIETYDADPEFSKEQNCYGQRDLGKNSDFFVQTFADLSFSGLETKLRRATGLCGHDDRGGRCVQPAGIRLKRVRHDAGRDRPPLAAPSSQPCRGCLRGSGDSQRPASALTRAAAPPPRRRRRFLKCMLLGAALYASFLLCWFSSHVELLNAADGSSATSAFRSAISAVVREAKQLQLMRMEFLLITTGRLEDEPKAPVATLVPSTHEERSKDQPEEKRPVHRKAAIEEAEEHARSVKMLSVNEKKKRRLKCVGWRATSHCTPHGPREPENDKGCHYVIPNAMSGYCEVKDQDTGELFRVMRRYCASLRYDATFRCSEAPDFVIYQVESLEAAKKALVPGFALPNVVKSQAPRDGIVMVVYPRLIASAYATIRALRSVFDCQLPIEIWYRKKEIRPGTEALSPLLEFANTSKAGDISFHEIDDYWATGFGAKVYAVYNSFFERVLFLDADNVPARDPTYMFESPEFLDTGAVFWPDFWHPGHTIFNIHGQSLLWEVCLDETSDPVHNDSNAPVCSGKVINGSFCGTTMVQHDPKGGVLFLHRNSNKLTGEVKRELIYHRPQAIKNVREKLLKEGINHVPDQQAVDEEIARLRLTPAPTLEPSEPDGLPDPAMWTHLLSFNTTSRRGFYKIQPYRATPQFPDWQRCYGQRELGSNRHFNSQEFADLPFSRLETSIRKFAQEAEGIRQRNVDAHTE
ncbi:unnamed protein product [Phytophthora fragariaefolia]|uniref:Unnamed protein product n=1 Tax=Phytophthora fragariaefolia TaxID=1490495 RepID=A0A9W6WX37_9STRA|nr:unnamed protein product [Phytophthora fragariaefolia]